MDCPPDLMPAGREEELLDSSGTELVMGVKPSSSELFGDWSKGLFLPKNFEIHMSTSS